MCVKDTPFLYQHGIYMTRMARNYNVNVTRSYELISATKISHNLCVIISSLCESVGVRV